MLTAIIKINVNSDLRLFRNVQGLVRLCGAKIYLFDNRFVSTCSGYKDMPGFVELAGLATQYTHTYFGSKAISFLNESFSTFVLRLLNYTNISFGHLVLCLIKHILLRASNFGKESDEKKYCFCRLVTLG